MIYMFVMLLHLLGCYIFNFTRRIGKHALLYFMRDILTPYCCVEYAFIGEDSPSYEREKCWIYVYGVAICSLYPLFVALIVLIYRWRVLLMWCIILIFHACWDANLESLNFVRCVKCHSRTDVPKGEIM